MIFKLSYWISSSQLHNCGHINTFNLNCSSICRRKEKVIGWPCLLSTFQTFPSRQLSRHVTLFCRCVLTQEGGATIRNVRPKFCSGIGNRNQGPITVSVLEPIFFWNQNYFLNLYLSNWRVTIVVKWMVPTAKSDM